MFVVSKETRINVRTTQEIKDDLEIVSRLRGIKVSSIVNGAMREIIRQEKEREPQAFQPVIKYRPAETTRGDVDLSQEKRKAS